MKRSDFLKLLVASPLALSAMRIKELENITDTLSNSAKMPLLFLGHGSPMNAIFDNAFTQSLQKMAANIQKPQAIMVISAHWETNGTYVSVNENPKTIYDFGGFDEKLYQIKYEPKGHAQLAKEIITLAPQVKEHATMGLDHGAWTVLKFIYPQADIPVFQLSLDYTQTGAQHYALAGTLKKMREKGVLIVGSGNVVHNLGRLNWKDINGKPEDWALEFDTLVKTNVEKNDFTSLVNYKNLGLAAQTSIPTPDHYLPLLYILGLADSTEKTEWIFEGFQYGNISMRCLKIG